jgi:hypothetical protein
LNEDVYERGCQDGGRDGGADEREEELASGSGNVGLGIRRVADPVWHPGESGKVVARPVADVMITIFGAFSQFSALLPLFRVKMAFFSKTDVMNIYFHNLALF